MSVPSLVTCDVLVFCIFLPGPFCAILSITWIHFFILLFHCSFSLAFHSLEAEGRQISAHKAVLAASSHYFKAMFAGRFEETNEQVVEMKGVSSDGLSRVIQCIYTTELGSLDNKNIEQVFQAADLLQIKTIVEECTSWMYLNVTTANCFKFLDLAEKIGIESLQEVVTRFMLENFVAVSDLGDFEKISKPALVKCLSADTLNTDVNEFVAYKAARKWILANEASIESVDDIMSYIRFRLIGADQLMKKISHDSFIQESKYCWDMIEDAVLYHTNMFTQPFYEGALNRPRGEDGLLIIPSSAQGNGYNVTENFVDMNFIASTPLGFLGLRTSRLDLNVVYSSMSAVQIENFLYLFGVNGKGYQNFAKRYDASTDCWLELASAPYQAAVGSAIAKAGNSIFLLGGMTVNCKSEFEIDTDNITDSVHVYNVVQNVWSEIACLSVGLVYAAATDLQENIYVTGGFTGKKDAITDATNQMWAYDTKAKSWLAQAPMNHKRFHHALESVQDKLYVIGGRLQGGNTKSVEMYEPLTNQWVILQTDAYDNFACSSFVNGNDIFLIGGDCEGFEKSVYIFETEEKKVTRHIRELPSDCSRSISASMVLPKLLCNSIS